MAATCTKNKPPVKDKSKKIPRHLAILRTMDRISMGTSRNDVLSYITENTGVSKRTAADYYVEAQNNIAEIGQHFHQAQIAEILSKLRELYDKAFSTNQLEFCLEILQNQAALSGLSLKDGTQNFTALIAEISTTKSGNGTGVLEDVHATIAAFMVNKGSRKAFLNTIKKTVELPAMAADGELIDDNDGNNPNKNEG